MESKINKVVGLMEEQRKKSTHSAETINNKVDKLIRLLSDVAENQKKNAKLINQLQRANEVQAQKEQDDLEKVRCLLYRVFQ